MPLPNLVVINTESEYLACWKIALYWVCCPRLLDILGLLLLIFFCHTHTPTAAYLLNLVPYQVQTLLLFVHACRCPLHLSLSCLYSSSSLKGLVEDGCNVPLWPAGSREKYLLSLGGSLVTACPLLPLATGCG